MKSKYWFLKVIKFTFFGALFVFLAGWVVMSLWNWLIPVLFNGPIISFIQALGLFALSKILFGGFKGGRHQHGWGRGNKMFMWKQMMENMSEEDREKFKLKMQNRCGFRGKTQEQQ